MQEVIIGLQFSALIPILVILYYKPSLNLFFKLLFASILLSVVFDILGTVGAVAYTNNIIIYCIYCLCSTILITLLWTSPPFYPEKAKRFVRIIGSLFFILMLIFCFIYNFNNDALFIISSLNVVIGVLFPLHFFYQKLTHALYASPLNDPYFFAAAGYILFSLSTIIILIGQVTYSGQSFLVNAWVFRQLLYLVYNLIIGYAFYILYLSQTKIE